MQLAYRDGGINTSSWFFRGMPNVIYRTAVKTLEPNGIYWEGMGFAGIGAAGMLFLTWLRQRFLWWPLHPIGFPIMASGLVDWMWFSVFLAWLIKVIILKYGGAPLFSRSLGMARRVRPPSSFDLLRLESAALPALATGGPDPYHFSRPVALDIRTFVESIRT